MRRKYAVDTASSNAEKQGGSEFAYNRRNTGSNRSNRCCHFDMAGYFEMMTIMESGILNITELSTRDSNCIIIAGVRKDQEKRTATFNGQI